MMKTQLAATQVVLIGALADQDFLEMGPFAKVYNFDFEKGFSRRLSLTHPFMRHCNEPKPNHA